MKSQTLLAIITLTLLTACGGGSGDNPAADTPPLGGNKRYVISYSDSEVDEDDDIKSVYLSRNGRTFTSATGNSIVIEAAILPDGFSEFQTRALITLVNGMQSAVNLPLRSYKGFYSGAFVTPAFENGTTTNWESEGISLMYIDPTRQLPGSGKATYSGRAFSAQAADDAALRYTIDFGSRRGSGEIAAAPGHGRYILKEAPIGRLRDEQFGDLKVYGVDNGIAEAEGGNKAGVTGRYSLGIAGPNAEEIIGEMELHEAIPFNNKDGSQEKYLFFHGTRGAISQ